jgi:hypothetical protein
LRSLYEFHMTRAPWTKENDTAATPTPANTSRRAKVFSAGLDMVSRVTRRLFALGFLATCAVLCTTVVSLPSPGQVALSWEAQQFANTSVMPLSSHRRCPEALPRCFLCLFSGPVREQCDWICERCVPCCGHHTRLPECVVCQGSTVDRFE